MRIVPLGRTGLRVSALALGDGGLLSQRPHRAAAARCAVLEEAVRLGVTFFDTADSYAYGWDERVLGAFARNRPGLVVASKVGHAATIAARIRDRLTGRPRQRFDRSYIVRQCHRSLRRLKRDHLDILYLHGPPDEVAAVRAGEAYEALERLKEQGKIRCAGVSTRCVGAIDALPLDAIDVVQLPFGADLDRLDDRVGAAAAAGVGVVLRQPFRGAPAVALGGARADQLAALGRRYPHPILFSTTRPDHLRANAAGFGA